MQIERLTLKLLAENCYIYHNEKECIVFDPGSDYEHIKAYLEIDEIEAESYKNAFADVKIEKIFADGAQVVLKDKND